MNIMSAIAKLEGQSRVFAEEKPVTRLVAVIPRNDEGREVDTDLNKAADVIGADDTSRQRAETEVLLAYGKSLGALIHKLDRRFGMEMRNVNAEN